MSQHEHYMQRCIELAKKGLGNTYPNPMVGSVIVYKGEIIGEGWHKKAGEAHAEVNAINSVKNQSLLKKATIYVSLEPCSHFGKTPPCSDLIIEKKMKRVVIGTIDPFAKVAGRGIKKLMAAGCDVVLGVLEKDCQALNKRFFTFHQKKRPFIILKWAQTQQGFIAPKHQEKEKPVWITGKASKQLVHQWRSEEQGILVGTSTALLDNPKLNVRLCKGNNPLRIVMDRNLKVPKNYSIYDGESKTLIITEKNSSETDKLKLKNVQFEYIDFEESVPQQICEILYKLEIQSVIIEGGTQTLQSFIDENLWDEARIFTGTAEIENGLSAPNLNGNLKSEQKIENDQLKIYTND